MPAGNPRLASRTMYIDGDFNPDWSSRTAERTTIQYGRHLAWVVRALFFGETWPAVALSFRSCHPARTRPLFPKIPVKAQPGSYRQSGMLFPPIVLSSAPGHVPQNVQIAKVACQFLADRDAECRTV